VPRFLADSSIWGWANSGRRPDITTKLAERFEAGEVVTCPPVVLEVLHRARTGEQHESLINTLFQPLDWLPLGHEQSLRAVAVQRELAGTTHGNHLRPAIDFLIAAVAESAADEEILLWFFDKDLLIICEHTGQPFDAESAAESGK
jgi:predicted nucleic acid-binding protein